MPVGVTVYWRCKQSPDEKLMEPGRCGDGTAREAVHEVRAHGDHNPRHGGSFFMAPDAWHHVEGTYPRAGLFRVYFYDNFTQPLDAKAFAARLVFREEFDTATSTLKELEVVPLKPGSEINALDAPLKGDKLPLKVTVKVKFTTDGREYRFDFGFAGTQATRRQSDSATFSRQRRPVNTGDRHAASTLSRSRTTGYPQTPGVGYSLRPSGGCRIQGFRCSVVENRSVGCPAARSWCPS